MILRSIFLNIVYNLTTSFRSFLKKILRYTCLNNSQDIYNFNGLIKQ